MKKFSVLISFMLFFVLSVCALAQTTPSITIIPSIAPVSSTSFGTWQTNAITALELNLSSYGTPGTPTYYQAAANLVPVQDIVLANGFNAWLGNANPTGAFASETGNAVRFGFIINGNGNKISAADISFNMVSTDSRGALSGSFGFGSYNYGAGLVGVILGQNGNPNTYVTSGANTQQVDMLIGRGSGVGINVYTTDAPPSNPTFYQGGIDNILSTYYSSQFSITGTYALQGSPWGMVSANGAQFFSGAAVPEPSTYAMIGGLVALIAVGIFRRKEVKF